LRPVVWSDDALADFDHAVAFVADASPTAARRVAARIERTAAELGPMPTGRPGRVAGTYEKSVPRLPYIIAYEIVVRPDGSERIAVLRVIHGARDWPTGRWPERS